MSACSDITVGCNRGSDSGGVLFTILIIVNVTGTVLLESGCSLGSDSGRVDSYILIGVRCVVNLVM